MKTNTRNKREQRAWEKSQEVLALRKSQEDYKKSFRLTWEARKRFCR